MDTETPTRRAYVTARHAAEAARRALFAIVPDSGYRRCGVYGLAAMREQEATDRRLWEDVMRLGAIERTAAERLRVEVEAVRSAEAAARYANYRRSIGVA